VSEIQRSGEWDGVEMFSFEAEEGLEEFEVLVFDYQIPVRSGGSKMNLLREYIRILLLTEAAKGPADLPDGISVAIEEGTGAEVRIYYAAYHSKTDQWMRADMLYLKPRGSVAISSVPRVASRDGMGECGGAWEVYHTEATQGWGPMLYDVAMEYATQNGGGLISDRSAVSPAG
jgi:hypothetical protein